MKRGILALAAGGMVLALATGCGSSNSNTTETTTVTVGGSTRTITSSKTTSTTRTGGLQAATTPKYGKPPAGAPVQSGAVQIAYRNIAIDPDVLKVKVGSTIKWTNYDPVEHNVTSKGGPSKFASKNFGEGGTFEFKASKAGVIHYVCTIHPTTMNGTIEVVN